jgi:hypothetical protein
MSNDNNSRDEWVAMWEVTRRPVCAPAEHDEHTAHLAAVAAERAAVVAWLRETPYWPDLETVLDDLAECIELGEHRREETK